MLLIAIACTDDWLVGWLTLVDFGCQTSFFMGTCLASRKNQGAVGMGFVCALLFFRRRFRKRMDRESMRRKASFRY